MWAEEMNWAKGRIRTFTTTSSEDVLGVRNGIFQETTQFSPDVKSLFPTRVFSGHGFEFCHWRTMENGRSRRPKHPIWTRAEGVRGAGTARRDSEHSSEIPASAVFICNFKCVTERDKK